MNHAAAVTQSQHVTGLGSLGNQRLDCVLHSAITEIAQKRIARPQGQESERGTIVRVRLRKKAVDQLIGSSVPAHGDKFSATARVGLTDNSRRIGCGLGFRHLDRNSASSEPLQSRNQQLTGATTTSRRIHDGQIGFLPAHNATTTPRSTVFLTSSASCCRLTFIDAVRGKSFSQMKYSPTRLKSGSPRLRFTISCNSALSKRWFCSSRRAITSV